MLSGCAPTNGSPRPSRPRRPIRRPSPTGRSREWRRLLGPSPPKRILDAGEVLPTTSSRPRMTDSTSVNLLALCRHSRKLLCIATSGQGMPTGAEPTRTSFAQWCQKVPSMSQEVYFTVTIRLTYAEMRADERTRTAYPCSLRVIIHALQGFARACKSSIDRPVSLLCHALCCPVLRSRWYQDGINITLVFA
jgi:hypothetical protein